jgi:hypothetical protein
MVPAFAEMTYLRSLIWQAKPMGPDACLYKQSQFRRLGDGPEDRDIPPIHYSVVPPFRAKQTQFRAGQKEGQVPRGEGVVTNGTRERL